MANLDETAGHITNLDLWLAKDGLSYVLYLKRSVTSAAMRNKFFPKVALTTSLEHCVIRDYKVAGRQTILAGGDDRASSWTSSFRL